MSAATHTTTETPMPDPNPPENAQPVRTSGGDTTPTLIAHVQVGSHEYRLVRACNHRGEPRLLIEQAFTDALGGVGWSASAGADDRRAVLEAYALGEGVTRPLGSDLGEQLRAVARWADDHGITLADVIEAGTDYRGAPRLHVERPVWQRIHEALGGPPVTTQGYSRTFAVDGVSIVAVFVPDEVSS